MNLESTNSTCLAASKAGPKTFSLDIDYDARATGAGAHMTIVDGTQIRT